MSSLGPRTECSLEVIGGYEVGEVGLGAGDEGLQDVDLGLTVCDLGFGDDPPPACMDPGQVVHLGRVVSPAPQSPM